VGTQFVLPNLVKKRSTSDLTPERQKIFEEWLHIYKDKMLSRGQYLGGLYDIGFDRPELMLSAKARKSTMRSSHVIGADRLSFAVWRTGLIASSIM